MKLSRLLASIALLITITEIILSQGVGTIISGSVYIAAIIYYWIIIISVIYATRIYHKRDIKGNAIIILLLICGVFACVRGVFLSVDYWDYKMVFFKNLPFMIVMPLVIYIGTNKAISQRIFFYYLKIIIPLAVIISLINYADINSVSIYLLLPLNFLLIFSVYLSKKLRLFLIVLAIATIIMNLESRLRIFSLALSLLLLILYYWRAFFTQRMIERFHKVLFVLPIILFFTAVSGVFNPFKLDELVNDDIVINANTDKEESLTVDTRTFLWVETLSSLVNNGTIVIGEGAAGRYASDYFDMLEDGRGRYGSETFILNIWLYLGIVGVILMGTIFYYASFLAIKRSNNYLSKVLGLLIVIYWCLIFVGINSSVNLDTFFIWITLGLCMSNSFRAMSDMEMKQWVRGITDKRYRLIK